MVPGSSRVGLQGIEEEGAVGLVDSPIADGTESYLLFVMGHDRGSDMGTGKVLDLSGSVCLIMQCWDSCLNLMNPATQRPSCHFMKQ